MGKGVRFLGVDVWRASFGEVSVKAIYELYRSNTGCSPKDLQNTPLRQMVNYLRTLDDPGYVPVNI